VAAEKLIG